MLCFPAFSSPAALLRALSPSTWLFCLPFTCNPSPYFPLPHAQKYTPVNTHNFKSGFTYGGKNTIFVFLSLATFTYFQLYSFSIQLGCLLKWPSHSENVPLRLNSQNQIYSTGKTSVLSYVLQASRLIHLPYCKHYTMLKTTTMNTYHVSVP